MILILILAYISIRIIPGAFIGYINEIGLPFDPYLVINDQPRYYSLTKFTYYRILGKYNYLVIMNFIKKYTDE